MSLLGARKEPERITKTILFDVPGINRMDVTLSYSMGSLTLSPNRETDQITGEIEYDPLLTTPHIDYDALGSRGKLDIRVESGSEYDEKDGNSVPDRGGGRWKDREGKRYQSNLNLRLPRGIPLDMQLELGLGEGDLDLTDLSVSDFHLECGLSDVQITMESPNEVRSRSLTIQTGLGDLTAKGLGNLKAKTIQVEVGLGSANLDLSGDKVEDMKGKIEVGLGSLNLILPKNANIRLKVSKSFLSSVDVDDLKQQGDYWVGDRWDANRPALEFDISVGLGSVDVDVE